MNRIELFFIGVCAIIAITWFVNSRHFDRMINWVFHIRQPEDLVNESKKLKKEAIDANAEFIAREKAARKELDRLKKEFSNTK